MKDFALSEFFDAQACDLCGDCLRLCSELTEKIDDCPATVSDLIEGKVTSRANAVLTGCSTCMTCSAVCHADANPYGLILYRWFERSREKGLPMRAALVMPLERGNAWHRVMDNLPPDERALLQTWSDLGRPELKGKALFAGCNLQIMPYMASPLLLGDLPVFGTRDMCCGEVYYRMGVFDKVASVAENLTAIYAEGTREVVAYCQACYNVLANILPRYFGARFDFVVSYFGDILAEKVSEHGQGDGGLVVDEGLVGL